MSRACAVDHGLRHTFASVAINVASITQVQAMDGPRRRQDHHPYLHHKSRADDAQLLSAAFNLSQPPQ